jgi:hypothetical protein
MFGQKNNIHQPPNMLLINPMPPAMDNGPLIYTSMIHDDLVLKMVTF